MTKSHKKEAKLTKHQMTQHHTYHGNYPSPDIALREPAPESLTKYGLMRQSFLKQHKPCLYNQLLRTERLYPHLYETQQTANERMELLMAQLVKRNPPPDKAMDNLAWTAHMNALKHSAEESILNELIYE